jgi:uncharacterized repeat protein (TIGR03943 family)
MRRDAQAIVLLLMGGALLRISLTDTYLNYVKEMMQPYLVASGALLAVLGLLALLDVLRGARSTPDAEGAVEPPSSGHDHAGHDHAGHDHADHDHADHDHAGHDHAGHDHSHGPRSAWLLLLPVFAMFLIAPPPLGAFAAARDTTNSVAPAQAKAPPLPAGDPVPISVSGYVTRAVWDDGLTLVDRTVEMTGFVTPNPAGGWWLTRLSIACCAADALAARVQTVNTADLPADTWVRVRGRWIPGGGTKSDDAIPFVGVTELEQIPQPRNPYE